MKKISAFIFVLVGFNCAAAYAQFDSSKANRPVASMAPKVAAEVAGGVGGGTFKGFLVKHAGLNKTVDFRMQNFTHVSGPMVDSGWTSPYLGGIVSRVTVSVEPERLCLSVNLGAWYTSFKSTGKVRTACLNEFGKVSSVVRSYSPSGWVVDNDSLVGDNFFNSYGGSRDYFFLPYRVNAFGVSAFLPNVTQDFFGPDSRKSLFIAGGYCLVVNGDSIASGEVIRYVRCSGA